MKKTIFMALVVLASASFSTVSANGKKDKKKQAAEKVEEPKRIELKSAADSLSFAAGMSFTNGLMPYLEKQYGLTEKQMPDFVKGLKEAIENSKDSAFCARMAGMQIAEMVNKRMLPGLQNEFEGEDSINTELVYEGFIASIEKNYSVYTDSAAQKVFEEGREDLINKKNEAVKKEGEEFLAANKNKEGVKTLASGLQYKVLKEGTGAIPTASDNVEVIYEGKTLDGNVFDATYKHNGKKTDTFGVSGLIKGWTEALLLMPVGSKWEIYIPQELAYGERGAGKNIKPYSALIFTLELVSIKEKPADNAKKDEPEKKKAKTVIPARKKTVTKK